LHGHPAKKNISMPISRYTNGKQMMFKSRDNAETVFEDRR